MFELDNKTKAYTVLKMACLSVEEALSAWNRQGYLTVSILAVGTSIAEAKVRDPMHPEWYTRDNGEWIDVAAFGTGRVRCKSYLTGAEMLQQEPEYCKLIFKNMEDRLENYVLDTEPQLDALKKELSTRLGLASNHARTLVLSDTEDAYDNKALHALAHAEFTAIVDQATDIGREARPLMQLKTAILNMEVRMGSRAPDDRDIGTIEGMTWTKQRS